MGALLAVVIVCPPVVPAMDVALLKMRLTPTAADQDPRYDRLNVSSDFWQDDRSLLAARERAAMRVSQDYVLGNLQDWARDTPLESLERLRRTDLMLGSGGRTNGSSAGLAQDVQLSVRLAETMRLRVSTRDFSRDILYDPVDRRMWVDLFQVDMPEVRAGLKLTNTYQLDNDSTNLILKLQHQLE